MRVKSLLAWGLAAVASAAQAQAPSPQDLEVSAQRIRADMAFLADDALEGREADTRGYRIAANYVAAQFAQLGLEPAGDDGSFFQQVPMIAYRPAEHGTFALQGRTGAPKTLEFGRHVLTEGFPSAGTARFDAPLVFAGYGIVAPEWRRNDYRGLDVRGKIVLLLSGSPEGRSGDERAFFGSTTTKRIEAARRGAIGVVVIPTPKDEERRPIADRAERWQAWRMAWRKPDGSGYVDAPSAPVIAGLGAAAGPLLFGADWPKVVDSAAAGKSLRAGDMGLRFVAEVKSETRPTVSWNVAAKLPGADRALSSQAIALTAHLDHLGIDPARKGDTIYNGALDNAVGVATLIEAARRFSAHPAKPRRSLLFVAMTAEEKGLIGSDYMSRNPLRGGDIVGLVNLDMPILTYDFRDVIAFGAEHSSIGQSVANAVSAMGLKTSPDPMPDESLFTRSDHYKFVQQGVPAVFLMTGFANGGAEKFQGFLKDCYHRPCDDLAQPLNYTAGARFAWVNYNIARELADADQPPRWNDGDFFGRRYAPKPR